MKGCDWQSLVGATHVRSVTMGKLTAGGMREVLATAMKEQPTEHFLEPGPEPRLEPRQERYVFGLGIAVERTPVRDVPSRSPDFDDQSVLAAGERS